MLSFDGKNIVFDINRCCQCGACIASCVNGALFGEPGKDGLWQIRWQGDKCSSCGVCVAICPAHSLPEQSLPNMDKPHLETFLAFTKDDRVRSSASSGGVARTLIAEALNNDVVELAYALVKTSAYPWAEGRLLCKPLRTDAIANSMYLPILVYKNLKLNKGTKSVMLVGTACQLIAADKMVKKKAEDIVKIAILCKQQKSLLLTQHFPSRLGLNFDVKDMNNISHISYRGKGWPGEVSINGRALDWEVAAALPYGKKLWRVPGCRFCPNAFGTDVDLTLADPWAIQEPSDLGKTLTFAWTDRGIKLLEESPSIRLEVLNTKKAFDSIGLPGLKRKQKVIKYYLGNKASLGEKIMGKYETSQIRVLESMLGNFNLPSILLRVLARIPNI